MDRARELTNRNTPEDFSEAIDQAEAGDWVVVSRNGRPRAALVPMEALTALRAMEDASDVEVARKRLRERSVPLEKLMTEFGVRPPKRRRRK
jgi:prevent-host-death family protein